MKVTRFVLAAALAGATRALAQSNGRGVADEIKLDELVLDARLSSGESSAIVQAWDEAARANPQAVSSYEKTNLKVVLPRAEGLGAQQRDVSSMEKRSVILGGCVAGFSAMCAVEAHLFESHDPAVLVDQAHKLVFERSTIDALVRGARVVAQRLNSPAPGEDAAEAMAATIRAEDRLGKTQLLALMQNAPALVGRVPTRSI